MELNNGWTSAYQSRPEQQARCDKLYKLYYYFLNLELFAVLFLCSATLYLMAHDRYSPCSIDSRPQFFAWYCLRSAHNARANQPTRKRTLHPSLCGRYAMPRTMPAPGFMFCADKKRGNGKRVLVFCRAASALCRSAVSLLQSADAKTSSPKSARSKA